MLECHHADDTQLHLAMCADNTVARLSVLVVCTSDIRLWYMQNSLQLNPDKSEDLFVAMSPQLRQVIPDVSSLPIAGVDLPVLSVLGVFLDQQLTLRNISQQWQSHHSSGEVVQLPCPDDTIHQTSADARFSADFGMQSDSTT